MAKKYTVTVKGGDYKYDPAKGSYDEVDLILKTNDFREALQLFMDEGYEAQYPGDEVTVTLKFVSKKK